MPELPGYNWLAPTFSVAVMQIENYFYVCWIFSVNVFVKLVNIIFEKIGVNSPQTRLDKN